MQTGTETKRRKRGDVRGDGKVFWKYHPKYRDGEQWLTTEQFATYREKDAANKFAHWPVYSTANREKIAAYQAAYRAVNRKKIAARDAAYRAANLEKIKARKAAYYAANCEEIRARENAYRAANRDKVAAYAASPTRKAGRSAYYRNRRRQDPLFALQERLRGRTREAFKNIGKAKPASTDELLGCAWEKAKSHIEEQFTEGMGWHNRCDWHIDHVIPLASAYDAYTTALLCDIHNLRPVWGPENISKSDTWHPPEYCI